MYLEAFILGAGGGGGGGGNGPRASPPGRANNGDQRSRNLSPVTVDRRRPLHAVDMTPRVAIRDKKTSVVFALTFTMSSISWIRV
jgi:hypothetical protein